MSGRHLALSCLIVCYVVAIGANAIPPLDEELPLKSVNVTDANLLTRGMAPELDQTAVWVRRTHSALLSLSGPLRTLTQRYVNLGSPQRWDMFANPRTYDQYVRLNYYVVPPHAGRPHVVRELILPSDREDEVRLDYSYQDKAVRTSFERFFIARAERQGDALASRDLIPVVRYFGSRYLSRHADSGSVIVRTEVWYGGAAMPSPGQRTPDETLRARLEVLGDYYQGPSPPIVTRSELPRTLAQEREADIVWQLQFVDVR